MGIIERDGQTINQRGSIQGRKNFTAFFLCLMGVLINFIFVKVVEVTGAPIYLDTVGTMLVSVFGGYLPGIFVGFLTNIVKCIFDPSSLYYGILNILIALAANFFAKHGWFKKPHKILMAVVCFSAIGGGLGTLIPWFLDGVDFYAAPLAEKLYNTGLFGIAASQLAANLIIDFIDKAVSLFIVLLISWLVPDKIKKMFGFYSWKQNPLSDEDVTVVHKSKSRVVSLQTKILLVLTVALFLIGIASTAISSILYRNELVGEYTRTAEGIASLAATVIDADAVDDYIAQGESAPGYTDIERRLYNIRESASDIEYIYVYKIEDDGCHVVFDIDTDELEGAPPGEVVPFDDSFKPYISTLLSGGEIEPIISNDTYGYLLTVYNPVRDSRGNCVCYAAADISMERIISNERNFLVEMISLFLSIYLLILALAWHLVEYHIIFPVNSMSLKARAFAYNSEEARENSVEGIKTLDIHTGDEIEHLYHAIVKTSDDSMRYVNDIQQKTETISKMQKALIIVLADMVESRDKNTGDHIRKTAAYTEIILSKMRSKGYYEEELSDEFIYNVVSSAPLHDIGKIQVPDSILNKPGRLTDEEFAKMKSHTTAGSDIIAQVISEVPDSVYLNEAKALAEFHHEKWDGSGYPHGISGEEIPLSARVMADADVFDALVSRRSYKEPFSYEKAMDIIREGAGSHFDPKVADAFLSAADEVRKVAEDFSSMN